MCLYYVFWSDRDSLKRWQTNHLNQIESNRTLVLNKNDVDDANVNEDMH